MRKLLVLLLLLAACMPCAGAENSIYYISGGNADRVHLREAPSRQAKSMGLYYSGTDVILIDVTEGWAWVMIGDVTGYVMADYLADDPPAQLGPWYIVDNHASTWVNLRLSPSMDGMIALCPDNGTAVHILGETADGWSYVECQGAKGYMVTDYLSPMEEAEAAQRTTILGKTADDGYIHQYIASNGKPVCFVSIEKEPYITFVDVNFDGMTDIVVFTARGASNFFTEFFVYDAEADAYVLAEHPGLDNGVCNYQLYPEYGMVGSRANNGFAGALHEECLFCWEGTNLRLIRRAVSEELTESTFADGVLTETTYTGVLHINVYDYKSQYEREVIWEEVIPLEDTEYRDIFTEESEALWQGIR